MTELGPRKNKVISDAIARGETIELKYKGNDRTVIPLAYGILKNGREALLCYKINEVASHGGPDLYVRLYHLNHVTDARQTGTMLPFSQKIDFYLTKHFREIWYKV